MYLSIYKYQEAITTVCFFSNFYYITCMRFTFLVKIINSTYINSLQLTFSDVTES